MSGTIIPQTCLCGAPLRRPPLRGRLLALFTNIGQGTNDFSSSSENKKINLKIDTWSESPRCRTGVGEVNLFNFSRKLIFVRLFGESSPTSVSVDNFGDFFVGGLLVTSLGTCWCWCWWWWCWSWCWCFSSCGDFERSLPSELESWCQCNKTFYGCKLRLFIIRS